MSCAAASKAGHHSSLQYMQSTDSNLYACPVVQGLYHTRQCPQCQPRAATAIFRASEEPLLQLGKVAQKLKAGAHLGPQTRAMCCRAASVSPASSCRSLRYTWHRTFLFKGCSRLSGPTCNICIAPNTCVSGL